MKATGIVRRIDDLGRVVIPKEIRRTMKIREGDPLEIYTNAGEVVFKKYSPMGELSDFASDLAGALANNCTLPVIICDTERCVAAGGISKKDLIDSPITPDLEKIGESRRIYVNDGNEEYFAVNGCDKKICVAVPVISAGDLVGSIVMLQTEKDYTAAESDVVIAKVAAQFLSSRTE